MSGVIQVTWQEDSTAVVLGRIVAHDGSGAATGVAGEGYWLQQADIASITCEASDIGESTTSISTPIVTIATDVLDVPVTTDIIWTEDTTGYNFIHTLGATVFPTAGNVCTVIYYVTTTGGNEFKLPYTGVVQGLF